MMAFCSSSDFKKKFIDETIRTPRNVPYFMTTMSLRNSEISRYFCVDGVLEFAFGFVSCVAFFGIVSLHDMRRRYPEQERYHAGDGRLLLARKEFWDAYLSIQYLQSGEVYILGGATREGTGALLIGECG